MTRYRTIVADPPWHYDSWPGLTKSSKSAYRPKDGRELTFGLRKKITYPTMSIDEIAALPVADLADPVGAHLYLWTTQRYLRAAFDVVEAWGFRYPTTLVWAKTPMGLGPGGTYKPSAEFILFARRGSCKALSESDTCWFNWPRTAVHSKKPEAFLDLVERVSPAPRLEMFARRDRLGWDTWGNESLGTAAMDAA